MRALAEGDRPGYSGGCNALCLHDERPRRGLPSERRAVGRDDETNRDRRSGLQGRGGGIGRERDRDPGAGVRDDAERKLEACDRRRCVPGSSAPRATPRPGPRPSDSVAGSTTRSAPAAATGVDEARALGGDRLGEVRERARAADEDAGERGRVEARAGVEHERRGAGRDGRRRARSGDRRVAHVGAGRCRRPGRRVRRPARRGRAWRRPSTARVRRIRRALLTRRSLPRSHARPRRSPRGLPWRPRRSPYRRRPGRRRPGSPSARRRSSPPGRQDAAVDEDGLGARGRGVPDLRASEPPSAGTHRDARVDEAASVVVEEVFRGRRRRARSRPAGRAEADAPRSSSRSAGGSPPSSDAPSAKTVSPSTLTVSRLVTTAGRVSAAPTASAVGADPPERRPFRSSRPPRDRRSRQARRRACRAPARPRPHGLRAVREGRVRLDDGRQRQLRGVVDVAVAVGVDGPLEPGEQHVVPARCSGSRPGPRASRAPGSAAPAAPGATPRDAVRPAGAGDDPGHARAVRLDARAVVRSWLGLGVSVAVDEVDAGEHPAAQGRMSAVDAGVEHRDRDAAAVGAGKRDAVPRPAAPGARARWRRATPGRRRARDRCPPRRAPSRAASARGARTAEKPFSVRVKTCSRSIATPWARSAPRSRRCNASARRT